MVLATDTSASTLGTAVTDADNMDLANMSATFDYEGCQGLPPGEVEPQMSELELSDSDSDSSVGSNLGACLDGFNGLGDAWMLDTEETQDNIQAGATAGVNDSSDIPWRTTECSAGTEDVPSAKVAKTAVESRRQPSSTLSGKTVTFDPQGAEIGEIGDGDGAGGGGVTGEGGHAAGGGVILTPEENKRLKRLRMNKVRKASQKVSPSHPWVYLQQPGSHWWQKTQETHTNTA